MSALIIFALSSAAVNAGNSPGTTGLNFLEIGVGPKAIGMGEAFRAVADDVSALYWNPAGTAGKRHSEISFMHLSWFEGINYLFTGYVRPMKNQGSLGAAIYYLSSENIDSYDKDGGPLGSTKVTDMALGLSYSRQNLRSVKGLDAGMTLKFIQENLSGIQASAPALDAGLLYRFRPKDSFKLAFVLQNIGAGIKFSDESFSLPQTISLGASYTTPGDNLTLALDCNSPKNEELFLNAGLNYRIADLLVLRAGYKFRQNGTRYDPDQGLRMGLGFGNDNIGVDYAFVSYGVLGNTHRFALTYRFGENYAADMIDAKTRSHIRKGGYYYRNNDLLAAYGEFKNVLVLDPVNTEAREYLQKIKEHSNTIVTEKKFRQAEAYISEDRLPEAKEQLENMQELLPDDTRAREYLAAVNAKLQEKTKQRIDAMYKQGIEFYNIKEYNEAISLWEKVLMLDPQNEGAQKYTSLAKEELTKLDAARQEKEKEIQVKKAAELYSEGLKSYNSGNLEKARWLFEESIKLNPVQQDSIGALAKLNIQLAEDAYNKGLKYYNEKKLEDAVTQLQRSGTLNPARAEAKELLGRAQAELAAERKTRAEEYNKQGLIEYTQGNTAKAIELWEKALKLDPGNGTIQNSLERAKKELGVK